MSKQTWLISYSFEEIESSRGVNPSQAARSRSFLNSAGSGTSAQSAVAEMSPMPGTVASAGF